METTAGSAITQDYIGIIRPITFNIGLTISENKENGGEYYFYTTEDIEITNIEVKALFSGLTFNDNTTIWEENDSYTFSVGEIKKKGKNKVNGKYEYSVLIKLIDSPYIPNNSLNPLCLRLYIYYTLNGVDRRIKVDTKNPEGITDKGEHLVYNSNTYTKRKFWPYSIQLDSIYRPFFFNAVLLFFEPNIFSSGYDDISGNTYGKFYFSIANGCTLRDGKVGSLPKYKIGDIKLDINFLNEDGTLDTGSAYNLTIKDNYRTFSEIIEPGESDSTYYNAHRRGIREYGLNDGKWSWKDGNNIITASTYGGVNLPIMDDKMYLQPLHLYENGVSSPPSSTHYKDNFGKFVEMRDFNSSHIFNLHKPLNVSFSVSDASIDGIDYKTISVDCGDIRFPWTLGYKDGKVTIPYSQYIENVTYIYIQSTDTNMLYNIFDILGKLNVDDYFSKYYRNDDIFNYLYYKHYGGGGGGEYNYTPHVRKIEFTYKEGVYEASVSNASHILAIYHGGYEVAVSNGLGEEEANKGDLLRYVNHTNKLLIMKLYKV